MGRFTVFAHPDMRREDAAVVRYRVSTLEIIRRTEKDARRLYLADVCESGRTTYPATQLLMQIFPSLPFISD